MRAFRCPHCGYAAAFEQQSCFVCSTDVAFPQTLDGDGAGSRPPGVSTMIDDAAWVRVRQLGAGLQLAGRGGLGNRGICFGRSALSERNPGGPDDTEALKELASTLKDLRRLIFQTTRSRVADNTFSPGPEGSWAFHYCLSSESVGHPVTIGHADGVITIDLAESLELYRERQRIILKGAVPHPHARTPLPRGRPLLRDDPDFSRRRSSIDQTRGFFGDERRDYQAALADYYAGASRSVGNTTTSRTTPPPTPGGLGGDVATICTSRARWRLSPIGAVLPPVGCTSISMPTSTRGCTTAKATSPRWCTTGRCSRRPQQGNHAMGKEALYPFRLNLPVVAKLGFVHHVLSNAEQAAVKK